MARLPATEVDPLKGITDEEIDAELEAAALAILPDTIAVLEHCTLTHFALLRSGQGIEVKFLLPLSERTKLPDLTLALQRSVTVTVERSRKRKHDSDSD